MRGSKFHAAQRGLSTKVAAAALLGASALAGCGGGDDQAAGNNGNNGNNGGNNGTPPIACSNPTLVDSLPGTGDAGSHVNGQGTIGDSDVLVLEECTADNKHVFHASKILRRSNDFGGASLANVTLKTGTGVIDSCATNAGGYRVLVVMEASGPTEDAAKDALNHITATHTDMLSAGTLQLNTEAVITPFTPPPDQACPPGVSTGVIHGDQGFPGTNGGFPGTGGQSGNGNSFSTIQPTAAIFIALPKTPSYVFTHTTQTGSIFASGFSGSEADLTAHDGAIELYNGHWDVTNLSTTHGDIRTALSTVGNVDAHVNTVDGNADVTLQLPPSGTPTPGFDLFASTNNGTTNIDVTGTVGDNSHRSTPGFDSSTGVKVTVHASSQNGDVKIHE